MAKEPSFASAGDSIGEIDVRLSYKIVELFSEGLYASANKAIEELVANSFDAGATKVVVQLPSDFHSPEAAIAVLDNGTGMNFDGLKQHWLIGTSNKRNITDLPKKRRQIGKFGIGKLATYVLANRLTHISKRDGKYFSTSMDYTRIDKRVDQEIEPKKPITLKVKALTEAEAKLATAPWTNLPSFAKCKLQLFGKGAVSTWTLSIMSDLKEKVHEIKRGTLDWVLRTALPLRDDFGVWLDGVKLESSKIKQKKIGTWVIGRQIKDLPKPAPQDLTLDKNSDLPEPYTFALEHPVLGRITGYVEAYEDLLTGKSDDVGRSHGFFVYVLGRLINVLDGHFGIKPDELRHGTFGRMRIVVNMDGLDDFLQSDRERIREGPVLETAQNLLRSLFNFVRNKIQEHDAEDSAGASLARRMAVSPSSISRRPIVESTRAILENRFKSRFISVPKLKNERERKEFLQQLEEKAAKPEEFVSGIAFTFDATNDDGIAVYDTSTGMLRINGLHPFVGAFFDQFTSESSGLPLEIFAMAEVLLESHLFEGGMTQVQIDDALFVRDQLLRSVAQQSGRRTALAIANALREARNDESKLEIELVACFNSLGFDSTRVGGRGKPDGVAKAELGPDGNNAPRRYAVTLEAKSKAANSKTTKVSAKTVGISTIVRQRDEYQCEHAVVVGPAFPTTQEDKSALSKEITKDREDSIALGKPRTVTLLHLDDLARLVQLRPVKRLGLTKIRELFQSCSLPADCKKWIDAIAAMAIDKPPYRAVIEAIHSLQSDSRNEPVAYAELRNELKHAKPPISYPNLDDLIELCKAMSQMAPGAIVATSQAVELDQSPGNVIAAIESATKQQID